MAQLTTKGKIVSCKQPNNQTANNQTTKLQTTKTPHLLLSSMIWKNAPNAFSFLHCHWCPQFKTCLDWWLAPAKIMIFCATIWWELSVVCEGDGAPPPNHHLGLQQLARGGWGWQHRLLSHHHTPSHSSIRGFSAHLILKSNQCNLESSANRTHSWHWPFSNFVSVSHLSHLLS